MTTSEAKFKVMMIFLTAPYSGESTLTYEQTVKNIQQLSSWIDSYDLDVSTPEKEARFLASLEFLRTTLEGAVVDSAQDVIKISRETFRAVDDVLANDVSVTLPPAPSTEPGAGDFFADGSVPMTGPFSMLNGITPVAKIDANGYGFFGDGAASWAGDGQTLISFGRNDGDFSLISGWNINDSFWMGINPNDAGTDGTNQSCLVIGTYNANANQHPPIRFTIGGGTTEMYLFKERLDIEVGKVKIGRFTPAWVDGAEGNILNLGGDFNSGNEFRAIQLFSNNDQYGDINSYFWQGYNQWSIPSFAGPQFWVGNSSAHHMHLVTADQNRLSIDPQGRTVIGDGIFNLPAGADIWLKADQVDGGMVFSTSIAGNWLARFVNQGGPDFIRFGHDISNDGDNVLVIQSDGTLKWGNGSNPPTLDPSLTPIFVNNADDAARQICLMNNTTEVAMYLGNTANDNRLMLGVVQGNGIQFFTQAFALTPMEIRRDGHITMGYDKNAAGADKRATDAPGLSIKRVTDQTVNTFEILDTDGVTPKFWIDKDHSLIIGTSPISYGFIGEHIAISSTSAETAFLARSEGQDMTVEMMMTAFGGPGAAPKGGYVGTSTDSPVHIFSNNINIARFYTDGVSIGAGNLRIGTGGDPGVYTAAGKHILVTDDAEDVALHLRSNGSQAVVESTIGAWGGAGENALFIGTDSNHTLNLYTNTLTRMNIRENGQTIVGTNVQPGGFYVPLTGAAFSILANSGEALDAFKVVDENNADLVVIDNLGNATATTFTGQGFIQKPGGANQFTNSAGGGWIRIGGAGTGADQYQLNLPASLGLAGQALTIVNPSGFNGGADMGWVTPAGGNTAIKYSEVQIDAGGTVDLPAASGRVLFYGGGAQTTNIKLTGTTFDGLFYIFDNSTQFSVDVKLPNDNVQFTVVPGALLMALWSDEFGGFWDAITFRDQAISNMQPKWVQEVVTLTATDITNQYFNLSTTFGSIGGGGYFPGYKANSFTIRKKKSAATAFTHGDEGVHGFEFTLLNVGGGPSGFTRVVMAGDWATGGPAALANGDVLVVRYAIY